MEQMDLVIEILLKLPVKSILRFKCVCKSWRSLIESPLFIDLHYNKSNMSNRYVLLNQIKEGDKGELAGQADLYLSTRVLSYDTLGYVDVRSFSPSYPRRLDACGYTKFDFSDFWIKGVCNGLLLVNYGGVYHRDHYALWNLATGETKVIPTCLCARGLLGHAVSVEAVGFGFDAQSKNYKVVMINKLNDSPYHHIVVEVYSLRTDSWRTAAIIPNSSAVVSFEDTGQLWNGNWNSNGVFSNGMYSCVANVKPVRSPGEGDDEGRWYHEIYSFDMSKEVITTTPLPRCIRECAMCINTPLIFNGFFALSSSFSPAYDYGGLQYFDIWVLGEYGVEESWSKVSTLGPFNWICRVLGFWKDNKVLGASSGGCPYLFDPVTEFITSVESPAGDTKLFFYKESLVRLS